MTEIRRYKKRRLQAVCDFLGAPLRILLPGVADGVGLTSLHRERWSIVRHYARGLVLDVGCGGNEFIREYMGAGYGVDPHFHERADVAADGAALPFRNDVFDAVTFIACLNHIPNRREACNEAWRVLRPGGRLIITMLTPIVGWLNHRLLFWLSEDNKRDKVSGEIDGMKAGYIRRLGAEADFVFLLHQPFFYGLNHLFLFEKPGRSGADCE